MAFLPTELNERVEAVRALVEDAGAELVGVEFRKEYGRNTMIFLVDKKGGISLSDCADINRKISGFFDEAVQSPQTRSLFKSPYVIEVNSPGLDRPLKTPKDFARVIGEKIKIHYQDEAGTNRSVAGILLRASEMAIGIRGSDASVREVAIKDILKAVRVIDVHF